VHRATLRAGESGSISCGKWFILSQCLLLLADSSLSGQKVASALSVMVAERGAPISITVDNGSEFYSRAMEAWAYQYGVQLDFIRPGRPVENSYIESFNGRLRDECLNVQVFFTLPDVRQKLEAWRQDYNQVRPHSSLHDHPPAVFARQWQATAGPFGESFGRRKMSDTSAFARVAKLSL
jgi:putative transposase